MIGRGGAQTVWLILSVLIMGISGATHNVLGLLVGFALIATLFACNDSA